MTMELKGQPVARTLLHQIAKQVASWQQTGIAARCVTILVAGNPASDCYARMKARMAQRLQIEFEIIHLPHNVSEATLLQTIREQNDNPLVHGLMVELPLPEHLNSQQIIEAIAPHKDIDGLTQKNHQAVITGGPGIYPATPLACIQLAKHYGISLAGQHVVLVGYGRTVGGPLFHLLLRENATVTVCHAGTKDLRPFLQQADVAFVAVGKAGLIDADMVHDGLVLIDAGINETPDEQIVGDVHPDVFDHVAALSPTPGGVGPVTTMQLFANLMQAIKLQAPQDAGYVLVGAS